MALLLGPVLADIGAAQVPDNIPPADEQPEDTVQVAIPPDEVGTDTIPTELREAAEAPTPALRLPRLSAVGRTGWDVARWQWTADELSRLPGMTLLEFVERLPGVVGFHLGGFGRPEGLTAMGAGGGRVRVFIDGYELDPYGAGSFPLETISVIDVRRITVHRSLSGLRVDVETFVLEDPEPVSVVGLGTGVYQTRLLRALFSRGFGTKSVGTGFFDLASTSGIGIAERYRHMNAGVRWDYVPSDRFGLQVEWRRLIVDRQGEATPLQTTRGDLVFRARARFSERVTAEAYVGRSGTDEGVHPTSPSAVKSSQGGLRAAFESPRFSVEVGARGRLESEASLPSPSFEVEGQATLRPTRFFTLDAASSTATADPGSATSFRVTGSVHVRPALTLFATTETGSRLVPILVTNALPEEEPVYDFDQIVTDVGGLRSGAEVAGRFGSIAVAVFRSSATELAPFGLIHDVHVPVVDVDEANGLEAYWRLFVPGTGSRLAVDGWYTRYLEVSKRAYAPDEIGRLGLSFHSSYFGGQLEPSFRLEGVHRGATPVPGPEGSDQIMPALNTLNFSLQLRILDVTAFLIWDNVLANRAAITLPGAPPALPRIVYGGSWRFRN